MHTEILCMQRLHAKKSLISWGFFVKHIVGSNTLSIAALPEKAISAPGGSNSCVFELLHSSVSLAEQCAAGDCYFHNFIFVKFGYT